MIAPPLAELNTWAPSLRSISSTSSAAASTGNASSTSMDVSRMFQVKIGIRNMVMPGARMQMIVVTKLTPLRMVPNPDRVRPMIHMSPPIPGEAIELVSGEYAYQPNAAAPPGATKLASRISPPNRNA